VKDTILLAGAAGVVGRRLVPLLIENGYVVFGTTRSPERATLLKAMGAKPLIVDVFDAPALSHAVDDVRPGIVIHQLTDLASDSSPQFGPEVLTRNARMRSEGTGNLVAAAVAAHVPRLIAQSTAWAYAPGRLPHVESDPLERDAAAPRSITVRGVVALEAAVLDNPDLDGLVLRYGRFYGPGTGADRPKDDRLSVHVDAAAQAALLAIRKGAHGAYNIAETDTEVSSEKARRELGWDASFRLDERNSPRQ